MKPKQPCDRNCPRRAPGCGGSCPDWAEYVKARDQDYARRLDRMRVTDAIRESYARMAKLTNR